MPNVIVEGFVLDAAFIDQSKSINGFLEQGSGKVASLNPQSLSYFTQPASFPDMRPTTDRVVNWTSATQPRVVVDEVAYATFIETVNGLAAPVTTGFFKLIDALFFDYNSNTTHAALEAKLLADSDIAAIYTPGSMALSATIVAGTVYLPNGTTSQVSVPSFAQFTVTLMSGSTTVSYDLTLYASTDAWLVGYTVSSVIKIIPAIDYATLYSASLINTTSNVFSTAASSANLSFSDTQPLFGTTEISGCTEYNAVLTDGTNQATVPFTILFKGRTPTLLAIRTAIQAALLSSGVGDKPTWQARIPGVFVTGRFYIIPFWNDTYTKPNAVVFPDIAVYTNYATVSNLILASLGYGDVSSQMDVFSIYYNRMQATAVPDLSGETTIQHLSTVIPDYQNYSPTDTQFAYMAPLTQSFSSTLNTVLAIDSGAQPAGIYAPATENLLTFYSYTFGTYEVCVITKDCFTTLLGSVQ